MILEFEHKYKPRQYFFSSDNESDLDKPMLYLEDGDQPTEAVKGTPDIVLEPIGVSEKIVFSAILFGDFVSATFAYSLTIRPHLGCGSVVHEVN